MPKIIQCIQSNEHRGNGTAEHKSRMVTLYHTLDGALLAENDPCWSEPYEFEIKRLERELERALAKNSKER